jgi:hypothetical protein
MTIDPAVIKCDCGWPVTVLDRSKGTFTCVNRACKNVGKVFRAKGLGVRVERVLQPAWKPGMPESHGHTI